MFWKKKTEPNKPEEKPDITATIEALSSKIILINHRLTDLEIEIDALKKRFRKKLIEQETNEKESFNNDNVLFL